jgi:hypothetical protein
VQTIYNDHHSMTELSKNPGADGDSNLIIGQFSSIIDLLSLSPGF